MGFFDFFGPDIHALSAANDTDGLIRALLYNGPAVQREAADALRRMGAKALPAIKSHLVRRDRQLNFILMAVVCQINSVSHEDLVACFRLSRFDGPLLSRFMKESGCGGTQLLLSLLADQDEHLRDAAIEALVHDDSGVIPLLKEALGNPSYKIREGAAQVLGRLGWQPSDTREAVQIFIAKRAWDELARQKNDAAGPLISLLSDDYYLVRREAARVLGSIGDESAVPALLGLFSDPDPETTINAIDALVSIGDPQAIPPLKTALQHPNYRIRFAAASGLAMLNWIPAEDNETILALFAAEQYQDLVLMGDAATPVLVQALGDDYYGIRMSAADTLMFMGDSGREALRRAADNPNAAIRKTTRDLHRKFKSMKGSWNQFLPAGNKKRIIFAFHADKKTITPGPDIHSRVRAKKGPAHLQQPAPFRFEKEKTREPQFNQDKTSGEDTGQAPAESVHTPNFPDNDAAGNLLATKSDPAVTSPGTVADALERIRNSRDIPGLVILAKDTDPEVRAAAVQALGVTGKPEIFDLLVCALEDPEGQVRAAASFALAGLGNSVISSLLLPLLGDGKTATRAGVAVSLGLMKSPENISLLVPLLSDPEEDVRDAAALALGTMGTPALPSLAAALKDTRASTRLSAVSGLGIIGSPALGILLGACRDPDAAVRSRARMVVARLPDQADKPACGGENPVREAFIKPARNGSLVVENVPDVEPFILLLCHQDKAIQVESALALAAFGAHAARPLIHALGHDNPAIQAGAAEALVAIGEPSLKLLLEALDEPVTVEKQVWILNALGKLGDRRAIPRITEMLDNASPKVRAAAAEASGLLGDASVIPMLGPRLLDPDDQVKIAAARALGVLGDLSTVPLLISSLGDDDEGVRHVIRNTLCRLGEPVLPYLIDALGSPSGDIRAGAAECLERLGYTPATTAEKCLFLRAQGNWIALGALGSDAIPLLKETLLSGDDEDRIGAIGAFAHMTGPEAIGPLIDALNDNNFIVQRMVMVALIDFGEPAREALFLAMTNADPVFCRKADQIIACLDRKCRMSNGDITQPPET